jgi:prolyl-tRNA synthetase
VYLARIGDDEPVRNAADDLYEELKAQGASVLYDDRDERPGEKFAVADLMGMPYRVVASPKSLEAGGFELKERSSAESKILSKEQLVSSLTKAGQD